MLAANKFFVLQLKINLLLCAKVIVLPLLEIVFYTGAVQLKQEQSLIRMKKVK